MAHHVSVIAIRAQAGGEELAISVSTVKTHVASVMVKLGARNRVELAIWAYQTRRIES